MRLPRRSTVGFLCAWGLAGQAIAATLTISPTSDTVPIGGSRTFTATLSGIPTTAVQWKVNGVVGGGPVTGTITSAGVYTAPAAVPQANPVTVTAAPTSRRNTAASAKVTVRLPVPWVTGVTPLALGLGPYMLTVEGDRFYAGAAVWANGVALPTTYVSAKQLKATGSATQVGTLNIEVVNPGNVRSAMYTAVQVAGVAAAPTVRLPRLRPRTRHRSPRRASSSRPRSARRPTTSQR